MWKSVRNYWRLLFCIIFPLILLPLIFVHDDTKKFKCLFVILLMGGMWMVEAMPLAVTALLPVALFPFLGIQSTRAVAANYMRETGMMFIGGISLALGIEHSGLHKRIALNMMLLIGISPWRILLGIMVTTFTLSCWIVGNTAVTAMMIPIVSGLVDSLDSSEAQQKLRMLYMLAVGYAANIGGTAVMIGSIPNLIFKDLVAEENVGQGGKYTEINFATWIAFNMPIALINLFIVWGYLGFLHLRGSSSGSDSFSSEATPPPQEMNSQIELKSISGDSSGMMIINDTQKSSEKIGLTLRHKLDELGAMSFHEWATCALFAVAVALWFTRDPQIFRGWLEAMYPSGKIVVGDSSVAIVVLIFMFIIPKDPFSTSSTPSSSGETLMSWDHLQARFPWSVILLVGGGFAISDGAELSGFSEWIGEQLNGLESLPRPLLLLVVLFVLSVFTEIASNAATVSLLTPILLALSRRLQLHPLYISFAGAIACQYAFILPTSNPPNAIVFSAGRMRILDMVKPGLPLNFMCLTVLFLMTISWGQFLFNFSDYQYPSNPNATTSTTTFL